MNEWKIFACISHFTPARSQRVSFMGGLQTTKLFQIKFEDMDLRILVFVRELCLKGKLSQILRHYLPLGFICYRGGWRYAFIILSLLVKVLSGLSLILPLNHQTFAVRSVETDDFIVLNGLFFMITVFRTWHKTYKVSH